MNAVVQPSLLGIILLVGLAAVVVLLVVFSLNAALFRRGARRLPSDKKSKKPSDSQGWIEAGLRAPTPTVSDIESQFGESGEGPPTKERP